MSEPGDTGVTFTPEAGLKNWGTCLFCGTHLKWEYEGNPPIGCCWRIFCDSECSAAFDVRRAFEDVDKCPQCNGHGGGDGDVCRVCHGSGRISPF